MANKWLQHLNNFRRTNRHVDAKDMMREARKTYRGGSASGVNSASCVSASGASGSSSVAPYTQNNLASTASSLQGGRRRSRKRSSKSRRTRRR
jgi:hypothetical protein